MSSWRASRPRSGRRERPTEATRAPRGNRAVRSRWRLEAIRGAPLPDLGHRVQEDLLRHRPGVPLVAAPAAAALRRSALRFHEDRPARLRCAALPGAAADERGALRVLLRG